MSVFVQADQQQRLQTPPIRDRAIYHRITSLHLKTKNSASQTCNFGLFKLFLCKLLT